MGSSSTGLVGTVLHDTHRIVRLIGQGGMGTVYEGVHVKLATKRFAIKILHANMAGDETICARFQQEALVTSELGHPHIVDILDFYDTDDGRPCMVMEYLKGEDLRARMKREGRLPPEQVIRLAEQVCSALEAVHAADIVHRDMKPANIFLTGSRGAPLDAKVLDFGISKIQNASTNLTTDNTVMGTLHHMSPEQFDGKTENVDHRADIFALGTICYQALCGKLPFDAPTPPGMLKAICFEEHPPITTHMPELGEAVDAVLARALAKSKEDRYDRALTFAAELKQVLSGTAPTTSQDIEVDPILAEAKTVALDRQALVDSDDPTVVSHVTGPMPKSDGGQSGAVEDPNLTHLMGLNEVQWTGPSDAVSDTTLSGAAAETTQQTLPLNQRPRWQWALAVAVGVFLPVLVVLLVLGSGSEPDSNAAASGEPLAKESEDTSIAPPDKLAPKEQTTERTERASTTEPLGTTKPPADEPPTPPMAPPTKVAPEPVKKQSVVVTLDGVPDGAEVFVDGKRHMGNPLKLDHSGEVRLIEVKAEGFRPRKVNKVLDRDQSLSMALEKLPEPKRVKPRTPKKKRRPAATKKPAANELPFEDL